MLGIEITNKEYLDALIEVYGNGFYDWITEYAEAGLPSYKGDFPSVLIDDEEIRNFIYDLMMNFYIARMLIIELNSPNGTAAPDDEDIS
jgi:hypothetical protein